MRQRPNPAPISRAAGKNFAEEHSFKCCDGVWGGGCTSKSIAFPTRSKLT